MIVTQNTYETIKESKVTGRYVVNEQITAFLKRFELDFNIGIVGYSVQKRPIQSVSLGRGTSKILMWSQMHGNEATTTKAVLDLLNLLGPGTKFSGAILEKCTIMILPILNPDGAFAYTRVNADLIDLNRDAQHQSQPESQVLRQVYEAFQPDFCFNLHDQRTIYNVGPTAKPATVSFLAPAFDAERNISKTRGLSMQLIVAMNKSLQAMIPGQISLYDDAFNADCVGDAFQMLGTPTILFEAGHYPDDYEREKTREYIFHALVTALDAIANDKIHTYDQDAYFEIPKNQKRYFDILIKNVPQDDSPKKMDLGILYKELLTRGNISFVPEVTKRGNLDTFFGHKTYDYLNSNDVFYLKDARIDKLLKD